MSTSSAARCATSCSASRASTSISRSRATGRRSPQALARELGGRAQPHDAFGTAVVEYGDGEHVDVVTARRERYDAPAVLPTVEPSTIQDDLFRRDFAINAMAVELTGEAAGRLVDPFEGRRDLDAKTIRVLHDGSFVDDPTRIFRALRYASRYGFELDEHTAQLAREAIESGPRGATLAGATARRARAAARRASGGSVLRTLGASSAPTGRSSPSSRPTRRRERCSSACGSCATATASASRRGGSASLPSRVASPSRGRGSTGSSSAARMRGRSRRR